MTRLARPATLLAVGVLMMLSLFGCSDDSDSPDSADQTGTVMVTITEQDGQIEADSDLVQAKTGQQIMFMVTSDAADEIHVHSEPEHEFEVKPGPEQMFTFTVDTPGTVEVESHVLDTTILKLEIS